MTPALVTYRMARQKYRGPWHLTVLDGLTLHRRCVGAVLAEQPLWLERAVWQRLQRGPAGMAELSDSNKAQVLRFINYFKAKRERLLADRESEKAEFISDRLADDEAIFSRTDVEALLEAYHAQVIGTVREAIEAEMPIMPADHRSTLFPKRHRKFVEGVDDCAQQRVAGQMLNWATHSAPDYILNVGDNFYWGGADSNCSSNVIVNGFSWHQWKPIYEDMYKGPGIDGRQWLGILGNHDYGGFLFTSGWHETIWYTWADHAGASKRWLTPAQFWKVKVRYPDFSIDYYFIDTNVHNVWEPNKTVGHNICSDKYNANNSTLHEWQIIVSHFPPEYNAKFWAKLGRKRGIDLFISGHRHYQQLTLKGETTKTAPKFPFTTIISGGGGGITSDRHPELYGLDDAYGFFVTWMATACETCFDLEVLGRRGSCEFAMLMWPSGFVNLSAVYVSQVLHRAEITGVPIDADLSAIEDQNSIDSIAAMATSGFVPATVGKRGNLPSLNSAVPPPPSPLGPPSDLATAAKLQEMEQENAQLRERYNAMQLQVSELAAERSDLAAQLDQAGAQVALSQNQLTEHLGSTTQFRDLKAIVKKRTDEVKMLREYIAMAGLEVPGTEGGVELTADDD
eukprot:s604_g3.t2